MAMAAVSQNGFTPTILQHLKVSQSSAEFKHRYILTGGPGVGKTSIIQYLKKMGYEVVDEAATDIIRQALESGIAEPWKTENKHDFNDSILEEQLQRQNGVTDTGPVFFDRSVVDILTYTLIPMSGTKSLETMVLKAQAVIDQHFYHPTVFFIDNFNECKQDEIRHESMDELRLIEKHLENNYQALGFNTVHIPPFSIEQRAEMILTYVKV